MLQSNHHSLKTTVEKFFTGEAWADKFLSFNEEMMVPLSEFIPVTSSLVMVLAADWPFN